MEEYLDYAKVFKALSDPKRAMIVSMLSCRELCACMILAKFKMSQSTLSHHMKLLCDCKLVKSRERGKWTYYSLDVDTVSKIMQYDYVVSSVYLIFCEVMQQLTIRLNNSLTKNLRLNL